MDHYLKKELYELLKKDDAIFDFLQDSSLDGLWYWDLEKPENEWMNTRFWEVLGYDPKEMPHLASAWQEIINQDDLNKALDSFHQHVKDPEHPYDQVVRYTHKTGSTVWVRCRGLAIRDKNGKPVRMLGAHQDITALKQSEIQLSIEKDSAKENESLFRALFEQSAVGIARLSKEGKFLQINRKFCEITGYSKSELLSMNFAQITHPDDLHLDDVQIKKVLKNEINEFTIEKRYIHKNKGIIWIRLFSNVVRTQNGEVEYAVASIMDITKEKNAEDALIKSEARYRQLIETASDAIYLMDENGTIVDTNEVATQHLKRSKNEIIGSSIDLIDPNFTIEAFKEFWKKTPFNDPRIFETSHINKFGEQIPVELSGKKFSIGDQTYYFGIARNIADRKSSEKELKKQRDLFELVINSVPARIYWKDLNSVYMGCNEQFAKDSGMDTSGEVVGQTDDVLIWKKDAEIYRADDRQVMNSGEPKLNYEEEFHNPEGEKIWWRTNKMPLKSPEGKIIGMVATSDNITEEKKAADELKESEEKFRGVFQYAILGMSIADPTGGQIEVNDEFLKLLGYSKKEYLNLNFKDISHPEDLERELPLLEKVLKGKSDNYRTEKRLRKKNGGYLWFEVSITARRKANGKVDMLIAMASDITERKKAAEQQAKEHSYLQMILDNFPIGIAINDLETLKISYMNRKFSEIYGWPAKDILSPEVFFKSVFPDRAYRKKIETRIISDIRSGDLKRMHWDELKIITRKGKERIVYAANIPFPEQNIMVSTIQNITDRRKAEIELKNAKSTLEDINRRYNMAVEGASVGIFDWNLLTNEIYYSPSWKSILGYEENELANEFSVWEELTRDEDVNRTMVLVNQLIEGKRDRFETEFKMRHKNGHWVDILARASVYLNEKKKPYRIAGTHVDISESKKHEKELIHAKEKAEESDRLKTEFLHNMSHEIRTPMNGIMGFSDLYTKSGISAEKRAYYASIVQNSSKQLLRIIDDILEISTLETKQLKIHEEPFSLNAFLMEIFSVFDLRSRERKIPLYVNKALSDELSHIVSDKAKLRKILDNLLENALKFTFEGHIELGYRVEKSNLKIYVKDTGIGISKSSKNRIFERFSQGDNKISGKHDGLGLGLSISKENAQLLGGDITLESEEGKGSSFCVTIPYKPLNTKPKVLNTDQVTYTLVIAEDEEVNFLYLEAALQDLKGINLNLIHAINGKEALEICTGKENIHLVLMDIKMPVMNGYEASRKIKAKRPDLPIIAQTAYATEADKEKAIKHGCCDYLSKPIDSEELLTTITKHLNI